MRATRFALNLPLRYRPRNEKAWREGHIENVSRSGVLFTTEEILQVDTPIEMSFTLPAGVAASEVTCLGAVVRTMASTRPDSPPRLAATITRYRLTPQIDDVMSGELLDR